MEVTRPLSYEERSRRDESEAPDNATRVMVSGEWIQFGITEKRSVTHPPVPEQPKGLRGPELQSWIWQNRPRTELVPNGTLELSIKNGLYLGARRLWHDGKRKRVEDCLNELDDDADGKIVFWDYDVLYAGERGSQQFYSIPHHRTVAHGAGPLQASPWVW